MPQEFRIERGQAKDYPELMDFLVRCFRTRNQAHERFETIFPDLYSPAAADMAHNLLARDAGRIVGCVGIFPIHIIVGGQSLEIGGIGGVSTDPEYRGRGIMQILLDEATRVMIHERGYSLAWLSGDRKRYAPWGFERLPTTTQFILDPRGPGVEKYDPAGWNFSGERLKDGNWERIWALFQPVPYFAAAGKERLRRKFARVRPECRFYFAGKGDRSACILPDQRDNELLAWAGDPEGVGVLLGEVMKRENRQFTVHAPAPLDDYGRVFAEMYVENRIVSVGNLAILNFPGLLRHFAGPIRQRVSAWQLRGRCRMEIAGFRQLAPIVAGLEADGQDMHLLGAEEVREPAVKLSSYDLARLFFGADNNFFDSLPKGSKWLAALGPLPFYLPQLFTV